MEGASDAEISLPGEDENLFCRQGEREVEEQDKEPHHIRTLQNPFVSTEHVRLRTLPIHSTDAKRDLCHMTQHSLAQSTTSRHQLPVSRISAGISNCLSGRAKLPSLFSSTPSRPPPITTPRTQLHLQLPSMLQQPLPRSPLTFTTRRSISFRLVQIPKSHFLHKSPNPSSIP